MREALSIRQPKSLFAGLGHTYNLRTTLTYAH